MSDIIGRLLDEAEKAQRKGHLLLAEVCRDASDQLGLITEERDRLRDALTKIATSSKQLPGQMFVAFAREVVTREALKETGHE
jgi:hypothetical protein